MVVVSPQSREAAEENLAVEGHKPSGQSDGASKSPPSKEDVQDDGGEEPPTEDGIHVPCGRFRVQLLSVLANFAISTINFYDWHRGQTIYISDDHQAVERELVLIGPRRPIGAYGALGIEVFPLITGCSFGLTEALDPYDSDEDEDEPRIYVERIDLGLSRMVEVTYLLIPNTIEAEIEVKLLPNSEVLDVYGSGVVSGTIKAWVSDYESHHVMLFSNFTEPGLIVCPGIGLTLPLTPFVVCLPYWPDLQLFIEVDLMVEYGQEKLSRIISNLKFTPLVRKLAEEVDDHRIEVSVDMYPDPLG